MLLQSAEETDKNIIEELAIMLQRDVIGAIAASICVKYSVSDANQTRDIHNAVAEIWVECFSERFRVVCCGGKLGISDPMYEKLRGVVNEQTRRADIVLKKMDFFGLTQFLDKHGSIMEARLIHQRVLLRDSVADDISIETAIRIKKVL